MAGLLVLILGGSGAVAVAWEWAMDNDCRSIGDVWRITIPALRRRWGFR